MKLRVRRLRSPTFLELRRKARSRIRSELAHRAHVRAYPGAYDLGTRLLADGPAPIPERRTPEGTALGLVEDHGRTPAGIRAALARIAPETYEAIEPGTGVTYQARAFDGPFWDRARGHLRMWLDEDTGTIDPA